MRAARQRRGCNTHRAVGVSGRHRGVGGDGKGGGGTEGSSRSPSRSQQAPTHSSPLRRLSRRGWCAMASSSLASAPPACARRMRPRRCTPCVSAAASAPATAAGANVAPANDLMLRVARGVYVEQTPVWYVASRILPCVCGPAGQNLRAGEGCSPYARADAASRASARGARRRGADSAAG